MLFLLLFISEPAMARVYDLYRSDRRFKGAFCTAIGGACAADADIITGVFENPAALATGESNWDFDGDYSNKSHLEPGMKLSNDVSETSGVVGASFSTGKFGIGMAFARQVIDVQTDLKIYSHLGLPKTTRVTNKATLTQFRLPLGLQVNSRLSFGIGFSVSSHHQELSLSTAPQDINEASSPLSMSATIGALYQLLPSLRLGSWIRFPSTIYESIAFTSQSPGTSITYREDLALHYPWIWAMGTQLNLNSRNTLFFEADTIGTTENGYLLSYDTISAALSDSSLRAKGRWIVLEPHIGYRYGLSEKTKLHLGTYYETSRWVGLPGRLHGTGGVSYLAFELVDLIAGIDIANGYGQFIFTFR